MATLRPGTPVGIFYVHTDHLNTPRVVTQPSNNAVRWRWDSDPFGTNPPNANPSGLGTFVYNLRFPGQYFDAETSLHYNYFRDYDPTIGRYVQSDPIGLKGGINTYAYVSDNPTANTDPTGEIGWWGAAGSAAFDLTLQLVENGGQSRCVDINSVLISAALGAVAPGIFNSARAIRRGQSARRSVEVLRDQLAGARTAARRARLERSIERNAEVAAAANGTVVEQASVGVAGSWVFKALASPTPWRLGSDCECRQ